MALGTAKYIYRTFREVFSFRSAEKLAYDLQKFYFLKVSVLQFLNLVVKIIWWTGII